MAEPVYHLDPRWTNPYDEVSETSPLLLARKGKAENIFHEELVSLVRAGLPILGTHLLEYSLITASVVTTGHLSTTALAAVALGSMSAGMTGLSIIQGLSSALDTVLPSAWTSEDPTMVGVWTHRMTVVLGICLFPICAIWFQSEAILLSLGQDPEVARLAAIYLHWFALGLPAFALNCVVKRYFQCQGLFSVPTQITMIVAPMNALLNWLLVLGPAPVRLGYIGAPIATAVSFNMVSLLSLLYAVLYLPEWNRLNQKTAWHPICKRSFQKLGTLFYLGAAGVAQVATEWWAWELMALGASQISAVALAAQSILIVAASTTFQAPFALAMAASVRIGHLLGEGVANRAKVAAHASFTLGLAIAGLSCVVFLLFRRSLGHLFTDDLPVLGLVAALMPLVALLQFFDAMWWDHWRHSAGSGQTSMSYIERLTAVRSWHTLLTGQKSGYYIIGLPIGFFLAFYPETKLGLYGLWIGLITALASAGLSGMWLCLRTDWDKEVVKVRERAAEEKRLIEMMLADNASDLEEEC
ncbi:MATE efflux family protein [Mycena sanguinolenta]|uniref:MATE efflux family protein n=1 Tax=Mycena sanguinolenta TaxID=230812 RepID=A0A8H6YZM4_9AGAR|nr:MATE efflux family protein [Mycena sanguinolenta]